MVVNGARIVLADTNIISYGFKMAPLAKHYNRLLVGREVRVTFVTVAEMYRWAEKDDWGARRRLELRTYLNRFPVVPWSAGIPELFAKIIVERRRSGEPMLSDDAWIAATAMFHDFPLVTHDANFLKTRGLRVISANPEILLLQTAERASAMPLDLDMRCVCRT